MPKTKNAIGRYLTLYKEIKRANPEADIHITIFDLMSCVREKRGHGVSKSTIEKDLHVMRHNRDLRMFMPIESYHIAGGTRRIRNFGYKLPKDYELFTAWSQNLKHFD